MNTVTKMLGALAALGACAGMATSAAANPYFPCVEDTDISSAQIHEMRVMMMVNALKCRDILPATMRSYGQLVSQRDGEFRQHANRVEGRLVARYGPHSGRLAFNDYETLLGNYHSNGRHTLESCGDMGAFVRLIQRAGSDDLHTLSNLVPRSAIRACPASDYTGAEETAAYVEQVRVHRGPAAKMAHEHASVAARPEPQEDDDLTPLATRVSPVTPLAKVDPTAAQAPAHASDGQSERLEQAIKALDSAAAALREMQIETPAGRP